MKKYIRIREDRMGRTIEAWSLTPEPKQLVGESKPTGLHAKELRTFIMVTSMMFWGFLGTYLGNLIFN